MSSIDELLQQISRRKHLADRDGPLIPLIAETGGVNVMLADSSALPEQLVDDVIHSAFNSAGQRCSALRVLYLQDEIADKVIKMLTGAMQTLQLGKPELASTDIGPVIDADAKSTLLAHLTKMHKSARLLAAVDSVPATGDFVAPHAFEINSLAELPEEVFGPVLHIIRYQSDQLQSVISDINENGYGFLSAYIAELTALRVTSLITRQLAIPISTETLLVRLLVSTHLVAMAYPAPGPRLVALII